MSIWQTVLAKVKAPFKKEPITMQAPGHKDQAQNRLSRHVHKVPTIQEALPAHSLAEPKRGTPIDEWIDDIGHSHEGGEAQIKAVMYATMFFDLHRFPAWKKVHYAEFMERHGIRLFCTFEGRRWRVTGCSRMGDVWLAVDPRRITGYDRRVCVDSCSAWSSTYK